MPKIRSYAKNGDTNDDLRKQLIQGAIVTPKLVIDRSRFPTADDEYTPAQRRIIDARLAKAEKGPFHGPFSTADEAIVHMKAELKKRSALKKPKRSR